jgi:hypothetical protein
MFGTNYNDHRAAAGFAEKSQQEADWVFHKTAIWTRQFAWLPHRCELTKKIIWLQSAYQGRAGYGDPNEAVYEYRWHDYNEHIIWELKRN